MEYRTFRAATVTLTAGILGSIIATAACDQPRVTCVTGRGPFAAKYTLVSGDNPACNAFKGDTIGIQSYNPLLTDRNRPDLKTVTVAMQAQTLGAAVANAQGLDYGDPDPTHKPYAFGQFSTSEPGSDDFCVIPSLAPAIQNIPALPDQPAVPADDAGKGGSPDVPAVPADSVEYDWTNVRFYVTPAYTGTQFTADLQYKENGCTAKYSVTGLYPAAACDDGTGKPADVLCGAVANPDAGLASGSGINPDFPVHCDPDLLLCVLDKPVPALR